MQYMEGIKADDFILEREIDAGRCSTVHKAVYLKTNTCVAMKIIDKRAEQSMFEYEIYANLKLKHSNIIGYKGWFEDDTHAYVVYEYAEVGDLSRYIYENTLSESMVRHVLRQIIQGVSYMHRRGWIHRDIKPENVLLFKGVDVRVGDLEFAIDTNKRVPFEMAGTPQYMAPEIMACDEGRMRVLKLKGKPGYGNAVDCWSIGVLAYECLTKRLPFEGDTMDEVRAEIQKYDIPFEDVSEPAKDFILRCLDVNPKTRMRSSDMLHHEWFGESKVCCFYCI